MSLFPNEDILTKEIASWKSFGDSLSSKEDRQLFEKMLNDCYKYATAINAKGEPFSAEPLIMALLLSLHKMIDWLTKQISKHESLDNNNKSYAADLIAPFTISTTTNSTQIMPLIPNSNSEPLMTPDNNAIIATNKRAYNPVVVIEDSTTTTGGENVTYMKQNANYSMSGTEDYVNSGWLLPKGQENLYPGSGNTFTMTFQKAGTYEYLCIIHPYMTGRVIVN
jgi:plastocyanin